VSYWLGLQRTSVITLYIPRVESTATLPPITFAADLTTTAVKTVWRAAERKS